MRSEDGQIAVFFAVQEALESFLEQRHGALGAKVHEKCGCVSLLVCLFFKFQLEHAHHHSNFSHVHM